MSCLKSTNMADRYIERVEIGELLDREYPAESDVNVHINYFLFQVEVTTRTESGNPLDSEVLKSRDLIDLFPESLFEWRRIVRNFGTEEKDYVFKIAYMVKYKRQDPPKSARQVEKLVGDHHLTVRDKFKEEVLDTSERSDVDVVVGVSRCCNYYNGGVN